MNDKSHLVPTPIVDKNGVSSIRHMKHQTTMRVSMTIPEPLRAEQKLQNEVFRRIVGKIAELSGVEGKAGLQMLRGHVLRLSKDFLPELEDVLSKGDIVARGVAAQISDGTHQITIEETLHFYSRLGIRSYRNVGMMVSSLRGYRKDHIQEDLRKEDEGVKDNYVALMKVTDAVSDIPSVLETVDRVHDHPLETIPINGGLGVILANQNLVDLVIEHKEEADHIADIVREHSTSDPNVIRGILSGVIPSLAEGHL